jgi:ribosomal protein L24E
MTEIQTWKWPEAETLVDRKNWPPGQWDSEPDKIQWVDEATDLDCLIVRQQSSGHLCGYVGVPMGHRFFGADYNDVTEIEVHGGLTFADFCNEDAPPGHGICHVPLEGRPGKVWWFGFDCDHCFDLSPSKATPCREEQYRNAAYVRGEVGRLAAQLAGRTP